MHMFVVIFVINRPAVDRSNSLRPQYCCCSVRIVLFAFPLNFKYPKEENNSNENCFQDGDDDKHLRSREAMSGHS
jgi:hypothetical protein